MFANALCTESETDGLPAFLPGDTLSFVKAGDVTRESRAGEETELGEVASRYVPKTLEV